MALLLVRGAGDIGSAVAHRLRAAGHAVVLHDEPSPAHARRGMAFTDAYFDKVSTLEGVLAKRTTGADRLARMLECGHALPVTDDAFERVLEAIDPDCIVDARMRKHHPADDQRALAPVVVGLGPGFVAGANAHLVVETAWGEELGKVIVSGGARGLAGDPSAAFGIGERPGRIAEGVSAAIGLALKHR